MTIYILLNTNGTYHGSFKTKKKLMKYLKVDTLNFERGYKYQNPYDNNFYIYLRVENIF